MKTLLIVISGIVLLFLATLACQGETEGDQPLKIGQIIPDTGGLSPFGGSHKNAANLAVKQVLGAGGQTVILTQEDNQTNSEVGNEVLQKLVDVDKVIAVVGSLSGTFTTPSTPNKSTMLGGQISTVSSYSGLTIFEDHTVSEMTENKFLFLTTVFGGAQGMVLARLAKELGYKSAAMMYLNNSYGRGMSYEFKRTFEANGGKIVGFSTYKADKTSFTSELTNAVVGKPDVMMVIGYPEHAKIYLREVQESGYTGKFLFTDTSRSSNLFEAVGWEYFEGMYGTAPGFEDTEARRIFSTDYEAEFSEPAVDPFMAETYDSVVLIALASAKAGTTTDSAKIRSSLVEVSSQPGEVVGPGVDGIRRAFDLIKSGQDIEYLGASGSELEKNRIDNVISPVEIWQIKGGKIVPTGRLEFP